MHLSDRRVHHFEALLRPWRQPEAAPFSTQEFVSFSEAIGLSEELDVAVLDEVAAELVRVPGSAVAVNVSGFRSKAPLSVSGHSRSQRAATDGFWSS